ncbi:MAG: polyamine ABC transporter substrate-binding protein, partial [Alphaproteobacteria bacterium]|nr:polyamine ABC transporter substrate-binding protein [Alphaproteobacteria bacterium]
MRSMNLAAACLAGCAALAFGAAGLPAQAQGKKTTLTFATATKDAGRLDPHMTATTPDKTILAWMFNGLVRFKPGSISPEEIEADIAEKWSRSPDGKVWTFNLRGDVVCHDGSALTADDVVYSLKRAADPKTSQFSSDYKSFEKVEAVDARTVRITLSNPVPGFLGYVSNYHGGNIVCKKAGEAAGENFKLKPIGTGPFMFEEYKPQVSVTLVANKKYYRGAPKLERIVYRYIESDASRDLGFQSGEIDVTYGRQDETWVDRAKKIKGAVVIVMEPGELTTLYLNTKHDVLKDIRVRQAIAHAIDRKEILQFKGASTAREAQSIVPIGYLGQASGMPMLPYDLAKAKKLLADAGHPNGVTIKIIHTNLPGMLSFMQAAQAQLKKAGINLEIDVVEHATFHAQIRKDLSPIVHYAA